MTEFIASTLSARKLELGLTLDQIAERTRWDRNTVDRSLKGQSALAVEAFVDIARAMDLDPADVLRQAARLQVSAVSSGGSLGHGHSRRAPTEPLRHDQRPGQSG